VTASKPTPRPAVKLVRGAEHTRGVSVAGVTRRINTASGMGRLVPNVLVPFAPIGREVVGERTRDESAATRRRGRPGRRRPGRLPPAGGAGE
jgi:DNA invertase Pin-like site-specific DNA recombinase